MIKAMSGKPLAVGDQGTLINYELTELLTTVSQSSDAHSKGSKLVTGTMLTPPMITYLGKLINGYSLMNMIVCLSQAPQNGWETWFSLYFGTNMAKL